MQSKREASPPSWGWQAAEVIEQRPGNGHEKHHRHPVNEPDPTRLGRRATLRDIVQQSRDLEVVRRRASGHEEVVDRNQVLLVEPRQTLEHQPLWRTEAPERLPVHRRLTTSGEGLQPLLDPARKGDHARVQNINRISASWTGPIIPPITE